MRVLSLMFVAAVALAQPTTIPLSALRAGSVVGVMACVVPASATPDSGCVIVAARLGAGLTLDTTTTPPTLRAAPPAPAPAPAVEKSLVLHPTRGSVLLIPDAAYIPASLKVWVNGLRYSAPDDYTLTPSPAALTFRAEFVPGDIVVVDYKMP